MMKGKKVDDPEFNWWTREVSSVQGAVAGIYTLPDLSVAYLAGGVAGDVVYAQITTVLGNRIRKGHQILLRDASDYRVDVNGKIEGVTRGSTNTVLAIRLLENDDNSPAHDLSDCDNFKIIGNINPEGGEMPDAITSNPVKVYNYTQIFRNPLSMTRTALRTRLRTPNDYQRAKAEALETHSWEMELNFLWSIRTENTGDNGKPERTTMGMIPFIRTYAPANCNDYTLNATYAGQTWLQGGETWFKNMLEQIFRYGSNRKMVFAGSGALLGIDALVTAGATMNVGPGQKFYGMEIDEWKTVFGSIMMKTHPLFSLDATTRNMMVIYEPQELEYMYIDDTDFYEESQSQKSHPSGYGQRRIDGINEEYLTEAGLRFGLPQKCAVLNGVGLDNNL